MANTLEWDKTTAWKRTTVDEDIQLVKGGLVPSVRTVNGHALSADVTLDASDVEALASTDVVTPSTSAEDEGKAADAYRTGIALAGKLGNSGTQTIQVGSGNYKILFGGDAGGTFVVVYDDLGNPVSYEYDGIHAGGKIFSIPSSSGTLALTSDISSAVYGLAPLNSPAFTGAPTTPNISSGSENGQVANKKYVDDCTEPIRPQESDVWWDSGISDWGQLAGANGVYFKPSEFGMLDEGSIFVLNIHTAQATESSPLPVDADAYIKITSEDGNTIYAVSDIQSLRFLDAWIPFTFTTVAPLSRDVKYAFRFFNAANNAVLQARLQLRTDTSTQSPGLHVIGHTSWRPRITVRWLMGMSAIKNTFADKADLTSPAFSGVPTAPTASEGTSSTQIATTEFVATALAGKVPTTRTVNNKALSADITIDASDVGALPITGGTLSDGLTINYPGDSMHSILTLGDENTSPGTAVLSPYGVKTASMPSGQLAGWPSASGTLALVSQIYAAVQQIAPAFEVRDVAHSYIHGDLVSKDGVVYQCDDASFSGPWSDGSWVAKKVSDLFLPLTGGTMDMGYGDLKIFNGGPDGAARVFIGYDNGLCVGVTSEGFSRRSGNNSYYTPLPLKSGILALLADTMRFSTDISYAVGDVCFYNGSFYRCSTAHSAGAWNASHFTEVIGGLSSGTPTTTPPPSGDSSTRIATTEFVATALTGKVDVTDFNDQSLLIAQNTENIAANTDDITELFNSKLDSSVGAPVFSPLSTYSLHEYVTNGGQLYRATTAITATGAWDPTKWEIVDMTSPDATLDITSQGQLRVVAADGTTLWHQGYSLGTTSSTSLSTDAVNCYTYSVNATGETVFTLPTPANGKVGDFILDITNPALSSTAADFPPTFSTESTYASGAVVYYNSTLWECLTAVSTAGAWTGSTNWVEAYPSMTISQYASENVQIVVPDNDELADMFTFKPGTMCELYFTTTAFNVDGKPTWKVVRQDVKTAGGGS